NTDGVQLGAPAGDPFTGGSRYVPGQASAQAGVPDPFTGGSRYVPQGAAYDPPSEYVVNVQGNTAGIIKKLAEFNATVDVHRLSDDQMQALQKLDFSGPPQVAEDVYSALLVSALGWPKDKRFPCLDLLRFVAATPLPYRVGNRPFVESMAEATGFFDLLGSESPGGLTKSEEVNLMMGTRAFANAFATTQGADHLWRSRKKVLKALDGSWIKATNPNLLTALSTLYLNLAIAATKKGDDDEGLNILSAASRFLSCTSNADSQLRLVNVFGVLSHKFQLCKDSARVLGDETIVILGFQGKSDAVRRAAKDVGTFLTS
ncbi:WD repeat protein Lub1, partial [Coemansia sp. RSA 2530]